MLLPRVSRDFGATARLSHRHREVTGRQRGGDRIRCVPAEQPETDLGTPYAFLRQRDRGRLQMRTGGIDVRRVAQAAPHIDPRGDPYPLRRLAKPDATTPVLPRL